MWVVFDVTRCTPSSLSASFTSVMTGGRLCAGHVVNPVETRDGATAKRDSIVHREQEGPSSTVVDEKADESSDTQEATMWARYSAMKGTQEGVGREEAQLEREYLEEDRWSVQMAMWHSQGC